MPTFSRRSSTPDTAVRLDFRNKRRALPPDRSPLTVRISLAFLGLAVAFGVLRSGSVELRDWDYSLVAIGLLSIAYWTFHLPLGSPGSRLRQFAVWALPAYIALQLFPLPYPFLNFFSSGHRAIADALQSIGLPTLFASVSVSPGVTVSFLFRIIGYVLIFLLVREFCSRTLQHQAWLTAAPLVVIGLAEAAWGIAQRLQGVEPHGGYANKNHFAGLLEMILPFAAARVLYLFAPENADGEFPSRRYLEIGFYSIVSILLFLALLDSQSKMGLISGVAALAVIGILWTLSRLRNWHRWLALACIAVFCLFGLVFLPSDELVSKFGNVLTSSQNAGEGRWPIWLDTINLVKAFPVFGCGLGTYQTAFLKFQTSVIDNTFAFAHNDYLQLLAELGLIGSLILSALIAPLAVRPFRVALRYSRPEVRYLALGCAGAITALALHSIADFNLYIPANAAVFVWILGISASLKLGPSRVITRPTRSAFTAKFFLIGLSLLLVSYSSAWIAFRAWYQGDVKAAQVFCRFAVCDNNMAVTAATPVSERRRLLHAFLQRDPSSPYRWADLGESLDPTSEDANTSFQNAVRFGPFVPPVLLRAAAFDAKHHENADAIALTSRVLSKTTTYDSAIFNWYNAQHLPLMAVLDGALVGNAHASQSYFRYLLSAGNLTDAATAWKWLLSKSYATEPLAHEYVGVLAGQRDYAEAAEAWAGFLGTHRDGYLVSNWVYNGGFEAEASGAMFDWEIQQHDDVAAARDDKVFQTGRHSLRLRFDGQQNLDYQQVRQTAYVSPGTYRFEAYVRTSDITTDEGIGFRIFDPDDPVHLNILTESVTGTHDWVRVTREIVVKNPTTLLEIRVDRKPSLRFDCNIKGTAWIDSISLMKN